MTAFTDFLQSAMAGDMAMALLHTLWQGLLIALALLLLLKNIPGKRPELRYRLSIVSLLAIVLCWLGTFSTLQYEAPDSPSQHIKAASLAVNSADPMSAGTIEKVHQTQLSPSPVSPPAANADPLDTPQENKISYVGWGVAIWLTGVLVMLARLFAALAGAARLKRDARDIDDPVIIELFEQLCQRMRMRQRIRLGASSILRHPGVIGIFRPLLLIPVSLISEISVDDLETIFAHELAHIRRMDYLVNFGQMIVEALLFFNPAVWWISRRIRIEREACCDVAGIESAGQRVKYAQVLFDQLAKAHVTQAPVMAAAVTAFSDDSTDASAERVKRIINPQHTPRIRIGWMKLVLWIGVAGIVLLGLWKTTKLTVSVAAQLMTPQERIDKMEEIAETHGREYRDYKDSDRVTLSGTVSTYNGMPVPKEASIYIKAYRAGSSYGVHFNIQKDGTFEHFVRCNENVFVSVEAPGYAPAYSETYHPEPNDVIDNIHIVLTEGFTAHIKVVNEQGSAIPNANLDKHYSLESKGGWSGYGHVGKVRSDENGMAAFEHCLDRPTRMNVQADGYQKIDSAVYTLVPNQTTLVTMKKGLIASGRVVAKEDGMPIPGAQFKLVYKQRPGHSWHYGTDRKDYASVSDASGQFILNTLAEDFSYTYVVEAEGYNRFALPKVKPGDKDLKVEMLPELCIEGRLVGDLSKLSNSYFSESRTRLPSLSWRGDFAGDNRQQYEGVDSYGHVRVEIKDGVGHFALSNILGDSIQFRGKERDPVVTVKLNGASIEDLVIDLDRKTSNHSAITAHPAILTFTSPAGYPPVNGKARLWYMSKEVSESDHRKWSGLDLLIENGVGKVDFPAPAYLRLAQTEAIKGFWVEPDSWKTDKLVVAGPEPYERTIVADPAGSIYGQILDEQGKLIKHANMGLLLVKRPEKYRDYDNFHWVKTRMTRGFADRATETGKFHTPTLPLGGSYVIVARDEDTWLMSKPIKLTADKPIQEVTLRLPETKQIHGRILLPDKTPAVDTELTLKGSLQYGDEAGQNNTGHAIRTDNRGAFLFEKINPQKPLKYVLQIKPGPRLQPLNIEVKPGRARTYTLKRGFTLKGKIVDDKTGWPIPGAWIYAEALDDDNRLSRYRTSDKTTDKDGGFFFTSLNNERYRLSIGGADIIGPRKANEIVGSKTKQVEYQVKLNDWSELQPRRPEE
jgi:beta-lactamase regulating signal transducer with metallopeptidase domain